nr:ATP-binding protein [Ktedonobacteraceae bacterium]
IRWLHSQIQDLLKLDSADKARQEKIKVIQTRIATIGTELERVQAEITRIEGPDKERQAAAHKDRLKAYVAFFENVKEEQQTLEELYAPVNTRLSSESASEQEQALEFSVRWEADLNKWLERGGALFDQRKTVPYGTMQDLGNAARRILAPAWTSGDPEQIGPAMETFLAEFRKPGLPSRSYLRSDVSSLDLLQWLYEVDHLRLSYGLKYNGVELEKLSPGTKGIVLLILYLGMDIADSRPLVVDQPDENLDNESIYKLLTTYFKTAKTRRQIILITHNPNLVVNGDSEQVIVATCNRRGNGLPHITYQTGSLENAAPAGRGIRHQVCRILEGGSDAFQKRERRYSLPERRD